MKGKAEHVNEIMEQLTLEGQHRMVVFDPKGGPEFAAMRRPRKTQGRALTLPERVHKVNKAHAELHRAPRVRATRLHREPHQGINIDTVKAPGRRFGPTSLRMLLPLDGALTQPMSSTKRLSRYQKQNGHAHLTSKQHRRLAKKRHAALARLGED